MKLFLGLLIVVISAIAIAQNEQDDGNSNGGRINMGNGQTTVRININDNEELKYRVRLLEEAVRDLQARVYELQDTRPPRKITKYFCTMITSYFGPYVGEGATEGEAEAKARKKCVQDGRDQTCLRNKVKCDKVIEEVFNR